METVGFAVGVISLASLFDTCIDLANCVRLANSLGRDYEAAYTKFLLLKSRLRAWGGCLNRFEYENEGNASESPSLDADRVLVIKSLTAIKQLLEDAQKLEQRYGLRKAESSGSGLASFKGLSQAMTHIERELDSSAKHRQQKTSWSKKITWAVGDKKAFDGLIDELAFHVNELEKLAARWKELPAMDILKQSIQNITSPAAVQLLVDTIVSLNSNHADSAAPGHLFVCNRISEQARVILGNVDVPESTGRTHVYQGNQITGTGRVIMGNVSGLALKDFWGL